MRRLVVEFTKMNGAGNDFIVIDNRFYNFTDDELSGIATRFCPRRTGIGADGVLALSSPRENTDFRMRYVNADGSVGTMCGNGARCVSMFAYGAGLRGERLSFETDAGPHVAYVDPENAMVRIGMVDPTDYRPRVHLDTPLPEASYLWTGTEHAVVFVDSVDAVDVSVLGPQIRSAGAFQPAGVNVNFVTCAPDNSLQVRTYEKGVESETLACGTGAVAAAVTSYLDGRIPGRSASVRVPGGVLDVSFEANEEGHVSGVFLSGPAVTVYRGSFEY
jgi:diaminopimelate epimerase